MVQNQIDNLTPCFLLFITDVLNAQMSHASPFETFKFQEIFNGIRNYSIQWVLTLIITFWRFGSSLGLQLLKWELNLGVWGFIPSHFHTLLEAWNVTFGLHFWPAPLQPFALVINPKNKLPHVPYCVVIYKPLILLVGFHIHGSRVTNNMTHNLKIDGIDLCIIIDNKKGPIIWHMAERVPHWPIY